MKDLFNGKIQHILNQTILNESLLLDKESCIHSLRFSYPGFNVHSMLDKEEFCGEGYYQITVQIFLETDFDDKSSFFKNIPESISDNRNLWLYPEFDEDDMTIVYDEQYSSYDYSITLFIEIFNKDEY